ncbi:uncharacterized protein HBSAL_00620 [Halobacterium salinarum]|uniref:Uncharacterized protein n=2 Tax=Halobacterium salinarum (strain ATCC 33171 / DSM 3754 / JCM 8978 / NBRC 102687 / NCIMB 764 / 91-R6) TaxID=2597657 RepID=A0A4D6GQR8_HALS9|nr:uncharacterized protein HBSAL_00620 [Halobacterium salinarum]
MRRSHTHSAGPGCAVGGRSERALAFFHRVAKLYERTVHTQFMRMVGGLLYTRRQPAGFGSGMLAAAGALDRCGLHALPLRHRVAESLRPPHRCAATPNWGWTV